MLFSNGDRPKFKNIDEFFQFIKDNCEKSQTPTIYNTKFDDFIQYVNSMEQSSSENKKSESFEDILKNLSCKSLEDSQGSKLNHSRLKNKSFEEIIHKLTCPIEDFMVEKQKNSDFIEEIPSSSSYDFTNTSIDSIESTVVRKNQQEILQEALGFSPQIKNKTIVTKHENLEKIFSLLRGEDNTKDIVKKDNILNDKSLKNPSDHSEETVLRSPEIQVSKFSTLDKNSMEITETLEDSTDDSLEIIINNSLLQNLQKSQNCKNLSPVKSPSKIDKHQSLLNYLTPLLNCEETVLKSPEFQDSKLNKLDKNSMEMLQDSTDDSMEIIINNSPLQNLQKSQICKNLSSVKSPPKIKTDIFLKSLENQSFLNYLEQLPNREETVLKSPENQDSKLNKLDKNSMELLQDSTDDSMEIIFKNLQKSQHLSPVKSPPKIKTDNFLNSLQKPKKFDIHQSLLNHLEQLPNREEIEYLCNSLRQSNLRFYSDGFRRIPSPQPFKQIGVKRHWKGKRKFFRFKKLKKSTISELPNMENLKETDTEEIFTQLTQVQVQIQDKSYSSLSKHSSFISNDDSEELSSGSQDSSKGVQMLKSGLNSAIKDSTLIYNEEEDNSPAIKTRKEIIQRIENIFLDVLEAFDKNENPEFILIRRCWGNCVFKNGRYQFKDGSLAMTTITPRTQRSRNKFFLMLYLLDKTRKLLIADVIETKREIYYQIKNFVKNQSTTDEALFDVSRLLDVGPWDLNVLSQRGLVFGDLNLKLCSGEIINCNVPGCHIPINVADILQIDTMAQFILVVEKDSVFHKLLEEDLPNKMIRPFILISGSGFPSFNTQLFLKKLWMIMRVPVFILVDPDPYGLQIMFKYRFGSLNSVHISHQLAVPKAQWLGVFPSEIRNLDLARRPLTDQDQKLVNTLLESPAMKEHPRIKAELACLLDINEKADIEGLIKNDYLSKVPKRSFQKEKKKRKEGTAKKLKEAKKDKQKLKQTYNILAEKDVPKDIVRKPSEDSLIFMGTDFYTPIIDLTQEDTMDLLRPSKKQMALNINDIQPMEVQAIPTKTSLKEEMIKEICPIEEMAIDRRTSDRSMQSPEQNPDHKMLEEI